MKIIDESHRAFVNLDHRKDRLKLMRQELAKVGIQAERFPGLKPVEVINHIVPAEKVEVMNKRTPGAIGCHYSQVAVMLKALSQNKHAFVMEDDLIFCDDFKERMEIMEEFLEGKEWDIIWLGGTYHIKPEWHNAGQQKQFGANTSNDGRTRSSEHGH
jgi:GR25 family glycosyltransferase involved in LPS biosynthesis